MEGPETEPDENHCIRPIKTDMNAFVMYVSLLHTGLIQIEYVKKYQRRKRNSMLENVLFQ